MVPSALQQRAMYRGLKMQTVIIAGEQDRLIDMEEQSARLHRDMKQSMLLRVVGAGHMVHQTATAQVMEAIDAAMPSLVTREHGTDGAADEKASTRGEVATKIHAIGR